MAYRQSDEALQRLNRGIEESRRTAQRQTMELAQEYFTDSVEALKRQAQESRARLQSLPDEVPGGQDDEGFRTLFGELMEHYSGLEACLDEAQRSAAALNLERLRRQGEASEASRSPQEGSGAASATDFSEPEETNAAHREAQRRGVDLEEVDGTGTEGRVVAEDVRSDEERQTGRPEATDAAHREARKRGVDLSEVEATGAEGQIIISDVVEYAESADRNTANAGTAASTTAGSTAGESATEGTAVGEDISGDASGENTPDLAEHAAEVANRAASDRSADRGREEAVPDLQSQFPNDRAADTVGRAMEGAETRSARETSESDSKEEPRATEAARRKADARGIDLSDVEGTGSGGQITVADVTGVSEDDKGAVGQAPRQTSAVPRSATGRTAGGETDRAQEAARQTDVPGEPLATNAARSRARKLGVDLSRIRGSGANGLITIKDVVEGSSRE